MKILFTSLCVLGLLLLAGCATPFDQEITVARVETADEQARGHRPQAKLDCLDTEKWDGFTCWPKRPDFGASDGSPGTD